MNAFLWIWCFLEVNCYPIHEDILRRGNLKQPNQMLYQNKVRDLPLISTFNISKTIKEDELLQLKDDNMKSSLIKIKPEIQSVEVRKMDKINAKTIITLGNSRLLPNFGKLLVSNQGELGNTKSLEAFKCPVHKVININKQNINDKHSINKYFNKLFNESRIKRDVPHMLLLTSMLNHENIFNDTSSKPKVKRCKHNGRSKNTEYKQRDAKVILLKNYSNKKPTKYHLLNSNIFENNVNSKDENDYVSTRPNTVNVSDHFEPFLHVTSGKIHHTFVGENDFNYLDSDPYQKVPNIDTIPQILSNIGEERVKHLLPFENFTKPNNFNLKDMNKFNSNVALNPQILHILTQKSGNYEDNLHKRHIYFDNTNSEGHEDEYYDNLSLKYSPQKDRTLDALENIHLKKQKLTKRFSVSINANDDNLINKNYSSVSIQKILPPVSSFNVSKNFTSDHYSTKDVLHVLENKGNENQLRITDTQYNIQQPNLSFHHEIGDNVAPKVNAINNDMNSNQSQDTENSINNINNETSDKIYPKTSNYSEINIKEMEDVLLYNEYEKKGITEKLSENIYENKSLNNNISLIDFSMLIKNMTKLKDRTQTGEPPMSEVTQQNKETRCNSSTSLVEENSAHFSKCKNGNKSELYSENKSQFKNEQSIPLVITSDQNLHTTIQKNVLNFHSDLTHIETQKEEVYFQTNSTNQSINNKTTQILEHGTNLDILIDEEDKENKTFSDSSESHQFKTYLTQQSVFYPANGINDQNQENITDKIFALSGNIPTDKRTNDSKPVTFISVPLKNYYSGNKILTLQTYREMSKEKIQNDTKSNINMPDNRWENNKPQIVLINDTQNISLANSHHLKFIKNSNQLKSGSGMLYNASNSETIHTTIDTNSSGKGDSSNSNVPQYKIKGTMQILATNPITSKNLMLHVLPSNEKINHIQLTSHSEKIEEIAEHSTLPSLQTILNTENSNLHLPYFSISNQESQQEKNCIKENVTETDIKNGDNSHKPHDSHRPHVSLTKASHNPDGYINLKLDNSHNYANNENKLLILAKQSKRLASEPENFNPKFDQHYLQTGVVPVTNMPSDSINYTFNGSEILTDSHKVKHSTVDLANDKSNTGSLLVTNESDTKISLFEHDPEEKTFTTDKHGYNRDINIPDFKEHEEATINYNFNEGEGSFTELKQSLNNTGKFDKHCIRKDQINIIRDDKLATYLDVPRANMETKIYMDNTEKPKRNSVEAGPNTFNTLKSDSNLHSEVNLTDKIPGKKILHDETKNTHTDENSQNFTLTFHHKQINNSEKDVIQNEENKNKLFKQSAENLKKHSEIYRQNDEMLEVKNDIMSIKSPRESGEILLQSSMEKSITNFWKDELLQTVNNSLIAISNNTKINLAKDENYEMHGEQINLLNSKSNCTSNNKTHMDSKATSSPNIKKFSKKLKMSEHNFPEIYNDIVSPESINNVDKATSANQPIFTVLKENESDPVTNPITNNDKPTYPSHQWNSNKNTCKNSLAHNSNQNLMELKSSREEKSDQKTHQNIWPDFYIYNMTTIHDIKHPQIWNDTTTEINYAYIKNETLNYASSEENNSFNKVSSLNKTENNHLNREFYVSNYYNSFPSLNETEENPSLYQSHESKSEKYSLIINEDTNKSSSFDHTISDGNDNSFISLGTNLQKNNTPNFYRVPSMDLNWTETFNNSNSFKLNPTEPSFKHQSKIWDILPDINDEIGIEEIQYYRNKNDKQDKCSPQLNNNLKTDKFDETKISGNIERQKNVSLLLSSSSDSIPKRNNKTKVNMNLHEIINKPITALNEFDDRPPFSFVDKLPDTSTIHKNIPLNAIPTGHHDHFTEKSISKEAGMLQNIHEKRNAYHDLSQLRSDKDFIYNSRNMMEDYKKSNNLNMMSMPANSIPLNNEDNIMQSNSNFNDIGNGQIGQDTSDQLQTPYTYNKSSPITFIGDLYMISKTSPQNTSEISSGENSLILLNHDFQIPLLIKANSNFNDTGTLEPLGKNNDSLDVKIQQRINSEIYNANNTEKNKDIFPFKAIIDAKVQNSNHESPTNKYFQSTINASQFDEDSFNSHTSSQMNNITCHVRNSVENQQMKPITKAHCIDVESNEKISNETQQSLLTANTNLSSNNKHGILITHTGEKNTHNAKRNSIKITNPSRKYIKKTNYKHNKSKSKYEIMKDIIVWFHDKNKDVKQR